MPKFLLWIVVLSVSGCGSVALSRPGTDPTQKSPGAQPITVRFQRANFGGLSLRGRSYRVEAVDRATRGSVKAKQLKEFFIRTLVAAGLEIAADAENVIQFELHRYNVKQGRWRYECCVQIGALATIDAELRATAVASNCDSDTNYKQGLEEALNKTIRLLLEKIDGWPPTQLSGSAARDP